MSGFLYFLPNVNAASVKFDTLKLYGLTHIVDTPKQKFHARGCLGPENIQGTIVGAGGHNGWDVGAVKNSDAITWKRFPRTVGPDGLSPWLGYVETDGLPTPAQLAREVQIPGESLTLADGCDWLVPVARDVEGGCRLPLAYDLDDQTGELVISKVRKEYERLWKHAIAYYTTMQIAAAEAEANGQTEYSFPIPDGFGMVSEVLSVNYRVSVRELATLGVLITGIVQQVADVLIDRGPQSIVKKKLANGDGTASNG